MSGWRREGNAERKGKREALGISKYKGRRKEEMEPGMKSENGKSMNENPCSTADKTNTTTIKMIRLELMSE